MMNLGRETISVQEAISNCVGKRYRFKVTPTEYVEGNCYNSQGVFSGRTLYDVYIWLEADDGERYSAMLSECRKIEVTA